MHNNLQNIMEKSMDIFHEATKPFIPDNENVFIYHYTSPKGLDGIISAGEHGRIWASDIKCMNDQSELRYSYELVKEFIYANENEIHPELKDLIVRQCKRKIKNRLDIEDYLQQPDDFYLISFSFERDNLNLWRCYTKTADCVGYNIGFHANRLLEYLNEKNIPVYSSGRVLYCREEQVRVLEDIILPLNELYTNLISEESSEKVVIIQYILDMIMVAGVFMKHPAFYDEQEYRIVIKIEKNDSCCEDYDFDTTNNSQTYRYKRRNPFKIQPRCYGSNTISKQIFLSKTLAASKSKSEVHFRERNGLLVPYMEVPIPRTAVTAIGISPAQEQNLGKYSVFRLLTARCYPYQNIDIFTSQIPYSP